MEEKIVQVSEKSLISDIYLIFSVHKTNEI